MTPEPGIYHNVPPHEYHAWDAASQSVLKRIIAKSPVHAIMPVKQTDTMLLGEVLHTLVFEPDTFDERYAVGGPINPKTGEPFGTATKAFAEWAEAQGKPVFPTPLYDKANAMYAAIAANEEAAKAVIGRDPKHVELSIVWDDPDTGVLCKARIDAVSEKSKLLWDVKTTKDASPQGFPWELRRYGYHVQAAHYLAGAQALGLDVYQFGIVAVENIPPHGCCAYLLNDESVDYGLLDRDRALKIYKQCCDTNVWPGYPRGIIETGLPNTTTYIEGTDDESGE